MSEARLETQVPIYPPGSRIAGRFVVLQSPPFDPATRRFVTHAEARAGKRFAGNPHLAGGMGMVYQCVDLARNGEPVALKTFQPQFLPNRATRDRFLKEATVWTELGSHPHLVRAHEVSYVGDGREVYLVLAWIEPGEGLPDASLRTWLGQGKVTGREAVRLLFQAAQGMARAVERVPGLVHGDLTTGNLLVGRDGNLRVTDFGLARAAGAVEETVPGVASGESAGGLAALQLTGGTGRLMGTKGYMAPEQERGETLDGQADRYAFGVLLAEVLAAADLRGTGLPEGEAPAVRAVAAMCRAQAQAERPADWRTLAAMLTRACPWLAELAVEPDPAEATREERVAQGWSYNAVGNSYFSLGEAQKAAEYFERVVALGQATGERELEGAGLCNLGNACLSLGEYRRALGLYEQRLGLARMLGDQQGEANGLGNLGNAYLSLREYRRATKFYEQQLTLAREIGDRLGEAKALGSLGNAHLGLGEHRQSIGLSERCLAVARELGDRQMEANALGNLGIAHGKLGESREAIGLYAQQLTLSREFGDRRGEANASFNLAVLLARQGEPQEARPHAERAFLLLKEMGHGEHAAQAQQLLAQLQGDSAHSGTGDMLDEAELDHAIEALVRSRTEVELRASAGRYPVLTSPAFVAAVAEFVKQAPPEIRADLERRMEWLRRLAEG